MVKIASNHDGGMSAYDENGQEIGYTAYRDDGPTRHIYRIHVNQDHRGKGIASELARQTVQAALDNGKIVTTNALSPRSRSAFKSAGLEDNPSLGKGGMSSEPIAGSSGGCVVLLAFLIPSGFFLFSAPIALAASLLR